MKTRDKILHKSLALFNDQGERRVSTNHIAAALEMSPGNLYYHFPNKEAIIFELFMAYEQATMSLLNPPSDRPLTYTDKLGYFEGILNNMWEYRFLHRDLEHLILDNIALKERYQQFAHQVQIAGLAVFKALVHSGLVEADEETLKTLVINIWVISTSWISFLHTSGLYGPTDSISRDLLKKGIYQIIQLEAPYLRGEAKSRLPALKKLYQTIS